VAWRAALALLLTLPALSSGQTMEQVTVRAKHSRTAWNNQDSPLGAALAPASVAIPVSAVAELAQRQPGIDYAGQGGLLQTISVRGLSGQRIANFWGDIPIISDRRAGTSSSFIDPVMLESVQILRGPSSVYYGNGAVAGVLQMTPNHPHGHEWQLQWQSDSDENLQYVGLGNEQASIAISRRSANDTETPSGTPLHTRFDQYNAQILWSFEIGDHSFDLQTLFSEGRDIGKSNSLFPDQRLSDYPQERHWLGQLGGEVGAGTYGSVFYHYQELETRVERVGERVNEVDSQSLDWGVNLVSDWQAASLPLRLGLDYLGRRNVESDETETALDSGSRHQQHTLDAEQDSMDIYLDTSRRIAEVEISGGLRWAFMRQNARGQQSIDDQSPSAFLRAAWFYSPTLELSLELASGVRFAGVSEHYFSGTTGRGSVLGNPDLDPEDTLSIDLGLHWQSADTSLELRAYAMQIDDYIERVELEEDLRSFQNLTEGEIAGIEGAWLLALGPNWNLNLGGHYMVGEDDDGNNLNDLAAPRVSAALDWQQQAWSGSIDYRYRFSSSNVGASELALDSADLLSANVSYQWPGGLKFSLWGRNLLDQDYRLSSDDLTTDAPRKSIGLRLSWSAATH
jgi:outer membrane receptor protein involved in Fe transport